MNTVNERLIYNFVIYFRAAKILSMTQIQRIPESIRGPIIERRKAVKERERWKKLTPEQRKTELLARRRLAKQRRMDKKREDQALPEIISKIDDQKIVASGKSK